MLNHGILYRSELTACNMMFPQYITQITRFMGPIWGPPGSCQGIVCMVWTLLYFAMLYYIIFLCYPYFQSYFTGTEVTIKWMSQMNHMNPQIIIENNTKHSTKIYSGCHFTDNVFRCIFVNEMLHILMKISLKFVAEGPNDNYPALVQIMALHRIGDKPLSEPMLTQFTDTYTRH